jgi:hypothetical protein
MQFGVFRLVDHTHAAASELLDDAVMRNGLAEHGATASVIVSAYRRISNGLNRRLRMPK